MQLRLAQLGNRVNARRSLKRLNLCAPEVAGTVLCPPPSGVPRPPPTHQVVEGGSCQCCCPVVGAAQLGQQLVAHTVPAAEQEQWIGVISSVMSAAAMQGGRGCERGSEGTTEQEEWMLETSTHCLIGLCLCLRAVELQHRGYSIYRV